MPTRMPAALAAGFLAVATNAITLPIMPQAFLDATTKPFTPYLILSALTHFFTPPKTVAKMEDRLLPSQTAIHDGSNGCGMMAGVDVCSLEYMESFAQRHPG